MNPIEERKGGRRATNFCGQEGASLCMPSSLAMEGGASLKLEEEGGEPWLEPQELWQDYGEDDDGELKLSIKAWRELPHSLKREVNMKKMRRLPLLL